jgi:hypothetical protein
MRTNTAKLATRPAFLQTAKFDLEVIDLPPFKLCKRYFKTGLLSVTANLRNRFSWNPCLELVQKHYLDAGEHFYRGALKGVKQKNDIVVKLLARATIFCSVSVFTHNLRAGEVRE